ncbi:MAG: murein biosynthesis integral membrane protein MurJ, partial [Clostridia bacterium]|nr:murein biosynthesis integral membrane protein MurJ [Clostridia bacterium]
LANMVMLLFFLRLKIGHIDGRKMLVSFGKTLFASLIMGLVVYFCSYLIEDNLDIQYKNIQIIQVIVPVIVGIMVYGSMAWLMRMEEAQMAMGILMRKLKRKRKRNE